MWFIGEIFASSGDFPDQLAQFPFGVQLDLVRFENAPDVVLLSSRLERKSPTMINCIAPSCSSRCPYSDSPWIAYRQAVFSALDGSDRKLAG
jgi:hypothetical protein